tara:strand:+ start:502 stop:984 length:483 start_codon:yes stop_codon:yes gene_type:complete
MRFTSVSQNFRAPNAYDAEELSPIVRHINESAKDSTPYSSINLLDEIMKVGPPLGIEGKDALGALAGVSQELVQQYKWYTVSGWGFLAKGPHDTMLKSVLYGSLPFGVCSNVQSIAETVQVLTGSYPDSDTLRKNLQRLVNNSQFSRADKGVYVREVKGL